MLKDFVVISNFNQSNMCFSKAPFPLRTQLKQNSRCIVPAILWRPSLNEALSLEIENANKVIGNDFPFVPLITQLPGKGN